MKNTQTPKNLGLGRLKEGGRPPVLVEATGRPDQRLPAGGGEAGGGGQGGRQGGSVGERRRRRGEEGRGDGGGGRPPAGAEDARLGKGGRDGGTKAAVVIPGVVVQRQRGLEL